MSILSALVAILMIILLIMMIVSIVQQNARIKKSWQKVEEAESAFLTAIADDLKQKADAVPPTTGTKKKKQ